MIKHVLSVVLLAALASTPSVGLAQDKSGERHQVCDITVKTAGSGAIS